MERDGRGFMSGWDIEIKEVSAVKVASLMAGGLPFQETVPRAFGKLMEGMAARKIAASTAGPVGLAVYYDDPSEVPPDQVRFKVAVPVRADTVEFSEGEVAVEVLPACKVAYLTVIGPYENLEEAYNALAGWVVKKGHQFADMPREVYVKWGEDTPAEDWVTEIQFPVDG